MNIYAGFLLAKIGICPQ